MEETHMNEDLNKISNQIATLESNMKGAIDGKVAELEAVMTRMRTNLLQITCEQDAQLRERVAKLEGSKTTWKECGKQMGYGALGAAVVMGGAALIDWMFQGPVTTTTQNQ